MTARGPAAALRAAQPSRRDDRPLAPKSTMRAIRRFRQSRGWVLLFRLLLFLFLFLFLVVSLLVGRLLVSLVGAVVGARAGAATDDEPSG